MNHFYNKILKFNSNFTAFFDYEEKSLTLTFSSGQKTGDSQCFMVAIYHSVVVEDTKIFSVNLTTTDSAVVIPEEYDSTIVTIYDDPDDSEFSFRIISKEIVVQNVHRMCN